MIFQDGMSLITRLVSPQNNFTWMNTSTAPSEATVEIQFDGFCRHRPDQPCRFYCYQSDRYEHGLWLSKPFDNQHDFDRNTGRR